MLRLEIRPDITLRPLTPLDAGRLFAHMERNREHLREWLDEADIVLTEDDARHWLEKASEQAVAGRGIFGGLFAGEELIGTAGFHHLDREDGTVEIGYWLGESSVGQGIMSDAVKALVRYAFEELRLNKVEIVCPELNDRSRAIPERLGFTLEGTRREAMMLRSWPHDLCHYGLLVSEWRRMGNPPS
jgi:ribosomal-protein-serine acetyltransferase